MLKIFLLGMITLFLGCAPGARNEPFKSAEIELQDSETIEHSYWGWRSPTCDKETDWKTLSFNSNEQADTFADTETLIGLKAPVPTENCFRVGTEVLVFNNPTNTSLAARALITKVIEDSDRSYVQFDVIERFRSIQLSFPGERIPNCDARYEDWMDFYVYEDTAPETIERLATGQRSISVWNGAYNCYRVGTTAKVIIKGSPDQTFGTVTVREVRLLPYSDLTDTMLMKTGEEIQVIRARLEAKIERNGGYISMMVFDYQK